MGITHFCLQNTYVEGQWGSALPQVVFGVAGMTTSGLILMMPETRGRYLPETISEAILFGKYVIRSLLYCCHTFS